LVGNQQRSGRRKATPTLNVFVLRGNSEILARLRALICFGGGGSESNAIFAIIQKEFLFSNIFCYTGNVETSY